MTPGRREPPQNVDGPGRAQHPRPARLDPHQLDLLRVKRLLACRSRLRELSRGADGRRRPVGAEAHRDVDERERRARGRTRETRRERQHLVAALDEQRPLCRLDGHVVCQLVAQVGQRGELRGALLGLAGVGHGRGERVHGRAHPRRLVGPQRAVQEPAARGEREDERDGDERARYHAIRPRIRSRCTRPKSCRSIRMLRLSPITKYSSPPTATSS